ncbi:MAG: hypothetical protein AAF772_08995 [Acidobacteriota bacterium]
MDTQQAISTILDQLAHLVQRTGPREEVLERAGLGGNYLYNARYRRRIGLHVVMRILDAVGVEPAHFFATCFPSDPVTYFRNEGNRLNRRERPSVVQKVITRFADEADHVVCSERERNQLADIDALRYDDHVRAAQRAKLLCIETSSVETALRALGIWASCQRMASKLDTAHVALWAALERAIRDDMPHVRAGLIQRAAYVASDRGHLEIASGLCQEALTLYTVIGDPVGVGRALVDQGIMANRRGQHREAIRACTAALDHLPQNHQRNRYAALHTAGTACVSIGDLDGADAFIEAAASACMPEGAYLWGRLVWLRARIAAQRGDMATAQERYQQAVEVFRDFPDDAALASVEWIRHLLGCGEQQAANSATRELHWLLPVVNRRVADALENLIAASYLSHPSVRLCDNLIQTVAREQAARRQSVAAAPASVLL